MSSSANAPARWALRTAALAVALVAVVYGFYALAAGLGLTARDRTRGLPVVFVIHALTGAAALMLGPVQVSTAGRGRWRRFHRVSGGVYVVSACLAALSGAANVLIFDVGWTARASFWTLSVLWAGTTLLAVIRARSGRFAAHRAWMVRSYALSLFFVSFSIWVPLLAGGAHDAEPGNALAVTLSWTLNLIAAEVVIRAAARPGVPA